MNDEIVGYFKELYDTNKYLLRIYNTVDCNWKIYMFKNNHIKVDIQTPGSLTSEHINIETVVEYIENQESDIKIAYTCYYDDFDEYKRKMAIILDNIKAFYLKKGKTIHIKYKVYWNL